jgi:hypothetical protein
MSERVKREFEEIYEGEKKWPNLALTYYDPVQTMLSLKFKFHFVI